MRKNSYAIWMNLNIALSCVSRWSGEALKVNQSLSNAFNIKLQNIRDIVVRTNHPSILQSRLAKAHPATSSLLPLTFAVPTRTRRINPKFQLFLSYSSSSLFSSSSTGMPKYWNRETSAPREYPTSAPIVEEARIVSLSDVNDDANDVLNKGILPEGASLVAVGGCMNDFNLDELKMVEPNVIFVSHPMVSVQGISNYPLCCDAI